MKSEEAMKQILRSEGYALGFQNGYAACMKWVLEQEKIEKTEDGNKSDNN